MIHARRRGVIQRTELVEKHRGRVTFFDIESAGALAPLEGRHGDKLTACNGRTPPRA